MGGWDSTPPTTLNVHRGVADSKDGTIGFKLEYIPNDNNKFRLSLDKKY